MELDTSRHARYFQRCYGSILPHHYTANDSNRLSLGYFIVAGLDLLSSPSSQTLKSSAKSPSTSLLSTRDKVQLRKWVLSLQHKSGGFCGSPQHVFPNYISKGEKFKISTGKDTENANIAATYFALMLLGMLADDAEGSTQMIYKGVNRAATLQWLKKLQRSDGSFGEVVKEDGTIGGGRDMRYAYMAAAIRWVLGGDKINGAYDFDVDKFVNHVQRGQSFDGGIAESAMCESHAGYAYCAVAALSLLDLAAENEKDPHHYVQAGIPDIPALVHYLVSRQIAFTGQADDEDEVEDVKLNDTPISEMESLCIGDISVTGFSGRPNKVPDTCYTWWIAGALKLLEGVFSGPTTVDRASGRKFLLQKTQHAIGGFGKHAGKPPDVYHSYLGLAALATMAGEEQEVGLGLFDVRLCIGQEAASRVAYGRKQVVERLTI